MTNLTKKNFVDAAKLLEKYGWIQGQVGEKELGFCALGALQEIAHIPCFGTIVSKLGLDPEKDNIVRFNDYVAESKEEVQTFLLFLGELAGEMH